MKFKIQKYQTDAVEATADVFAGQPNRTAKYTRNLSLSIGIKTVKFQRGYGHPGKPPKQMRFEVKSVRLLDASDRECDPYAIPPGFIATTIAIHLGKRIG